MAAVRSCSNGRVNIVLLLCALVLSIVGVVLSIIGGGMDDINSKADKNFPELRRQMEEDDPTVCRVGGVAMNDEDCRAKITADIEDRILVRALSAPTAA